MPATVLVFHTESRLSPWLEAVTERWTVAVADKGYDALRMAQTGRPPVVLTDASHAGINLLRSIALTVPEVRAVVITSDTLEAPPRNVAVTLTGEDTASVLSAISSLLTESMRPESV